ncbi:TnsA endonuclease N-terminal domain-containing protein [uncultured Tolumonas sp.]|uniref:TnsA endonuclease N-terminal domain-containing protein n=1 Tax=uncultured Tolumonas sp. TaxID=263765 RepID=UPI002A0A4E2E|nr:TnsA endonuclease N-terminal domain-containing protein [uncultured Tolumonas sp.]
MPEGRKINLRYIFSSGIQASTKSYKSLSFESELEKKFINCLIFDHSIQSIQTQPFTILSHNTRNNRYTPDILVERLITIDNLEYIQKTVFEIKPQKILQEEWKRFSLRFKMATKWCKERGYLFKLVTEKYIETPYLKNINFLLQYDRSRFPTSDLGTATEIESQVNNILIHQHLSINELLQSLSQDKKTQQQLLPYIWMLVRDGRLNVDLTTQLTMNTIIWNGEPPFDYNFEQSPIRRRFRSRIITP